MDHVGAVTYVDYSPTGKEFVTASYDKSIRLFEADKGHSRDIYHTKRMQRLTCVQWTLDNKYILSGSDEMNIRIWKARASEKLGPVCCVISCLMLHYMLLFLAETSGESFLELQRSSKRKVRHSSTNQTN